MNRIALALIVASLTGCAMTPEQQSNFGRNFAAGLYAGSAISAAQRPIYVQQPIYTRTTTCRRSGNTVQCSDF